MAEPPEPPEVDVEIVKKIIILRFRCSTGVAILQGVTDVTLGALYGTEKIRPVIESIFQSVFGFCKITPGSIVVDVDCFSAKHVNELLDDYKCGKLKRRFVEELRKIDGEVEDLKITFELNETLEMNANHKTRDEKQSRKTGERTSGMSEQEYLETLDSIRKLVGETAKLMELAQESSYRIIEDKNYFPDNRELDTSDEHGRTILHYAAAVEDEFLVKHLCDLSPSSINTRDCDGRTPLHLACIPAGPPYFSRHKSFKHSLFSYRFKLYNYLSKAINAKDSEDRTPLHYAAMFYQGSNVEGLFQNDADGYVIDAYGKTALDYAFKYGGISAIESLLRNYEREKARKVKSTLKIMKDINTVDEEGRNILHKAAAFASHEAITVLLEASVDINAKDKIGNTALDYALEHSNVKSAVTILDHILEKQRKEKPVHPCVAPLISKKIQTKDSFARTMLHHSVIHSKQNVFNLLLTHDVDVNNRDDAGKTPLHYAFQHGNIEAAEKLLEAGASVDEKDKNGRTVVHLAAEYGEEKLLNLLIRVDANLNALDNYGNSAVFYAVKHRAEAIAEKLVQAGVSIESKDAEGRTVLNLAFEHSHEKLIRLLLKYVDSSGNSAVFYAVKNRELAIAENMIKEGANVEGKDKKGRTVLHLAAEDGNEILVDLLLENDVDVKKIDSKGNSALHSAVSGGNVAIVEKLIKSGASVEGINNKGQTVLHRAAEYGNEILADLLLKNNVDVKQIDSKRNSILHSAVIGGNVAIAEKLIKAGLSVKAKNDKGQTVLHLAVQRDDERMLDFLLKYNVNVNNLDYRGKSALYFALEKSFETANHKLSFMLAKAGAKAPLIKEEKGRTLLHIAVWENKIDVLKILVKCGVFLNDCDDEGETSLHLAVSSGHAAAARILVEAGVDMNVRNKKNLTPLHLAVMLSQDEVIKLLLKHEADPTVEDHRGRTALRCAVDLHRKQDIIQRIEEGIKSLSLKDKSTTIGPSGGVIQLDEVTLEIPAGCLTEDTKITLARKDPRDFTPNSLQTLGVPVARQRAVELLPRGLKFLKPAVLLIRSKWTVFNSKHFILHGSYNDNQQKMVWDVMTNNMKSDDDKEVLIAKINGFSVVFDFILMIRGMLARIQCHYNYSFVCRAYALYRRQRSVAAVDIAVVIISEFVDVNDEEDIRQLKDHFDEGYLIGEKGRLTRVNTDHHLQICLNFLGVQSNQDSFKIDQSLLDSDGYVYAIRNFSGIALEGPVDGNVEIREEIEDVLLWKLNVREEETHVQSSEAERIPEEGPVDGNVEIKEEIEDVLLWKLNVREEETHVQSSETERIPEVVYRTTKLTNAEISRISCRLGLDWDSLAGLLDIPYYEREDIRFNYLDYFSKAEKVLLIFINSQFFDRHILEKCLDELERQDLIDLMLPVENEMQISQAVEAGLSETQDSENKQLDKTRLSSRELYRISRRIVEDWMRLAGLLDIPAEDRIIIRSENKYNDVRSQAEKMLSIFNRSKYFSREKLTCCLKEIGLLYLIEPILTGKWRSL